MGALSKIKYVFTVLGILMLVGAFSLYNNTQKFLDGAITAEGTVIELLKSRSSDSTTYTPLVQFTTKNNEVVDFTSLVSSNPPSYKTGESVEVLYQEASPDDAKIKSYFSLWGGATIVGALGVVFFLVGSSIFLFGKRKQQKIQFLQQSGIPIKSKFKSVEINRSFESNGRSPYQIYAQWLNPATSELHVFKSENIWFNPSDHIRTDEITVLIENNNPKKYHMDISFLPKLAD